MPTWRFSGLGSSLLAFLMGTTAAIDPASAQTAGTVGAVNKNATGQPPGSSARSLGVGQSVVQNERIATDANGTVHIMFKDRSALNVGRNSTVVIDRFVYNPSAGAGEMTVSMARGVARFVGGQVSHSSGATVRTPVASIGVRGGNVTLVYNNNTLTVIVHSGAATVTNAFGSVTVRAGMQVTVPRNGPPGSPQSIDMALLRFLTLQLASHGGQAGGSPTKPGDDQAARNQVGISRPASQGLNYDLPGIGDDIARSFGTTINQPYP